MRNSKKIRCSEILMWFEENMPQAESELNFRNTFELIVAVMLSAQCTDKRVNMVTPNLFAKYPNAEMLAGATERDIYELIKSISYPNAKAKHVLEMAKMLVSKFGSEVPNEMEKLLLLPGVGRKTANVVLAVGFGKPAMPVDTHVFRVAHRLGLSDGNTPELVEKDLIKIISQGVLSKAHHWFLLHGRYICKAIKPKCKECGLSQYCENKDLIK